MDTTQDVMGQGMSGDRWRQGCRVPHHVYRQLGPEPDQRPWPDRDPPVAMFLDPTDAMRAVAAVNAQLGEETLRTATASTVYLVVAKEYDDYRVIAVLAVEAEAKAFADDYNSRPHTWSWSRADVEPVEFYAAGWRPAPREVLDDNGDGG